MSSVQVTVEESKRLLGRPLKRLEDPKFITGSGIFLDDVKMPNMLVAAFVRSPHSHAKIVSVDVSRALRSPKVRGVLTGKDLDGKVTTIPTIDTEGEKKGSPRMVLPTDEVNYAGEPVAMILAEDMYSAQDATEAVEVEYEPLDPVVDAIEAMKPGSPKVHHYLSDNIAYHLAYSTGDVDAAFRGADEVVKVELLNQRVHPVSLEPRGVAASYDEGNDIVTIWLSTQDPHGLRNGLAGILKLPQAKVRLIAPDTGGGFGGKAAPYPEDVAVAFAAKHFRRPVKWMEDRREHLLNLTHGRGQNQWAELAVRRDGKVLGLKVKVVSDAGAYSTADNNSIPELTYQMATGVYDVPAYHAEIYSIYTNKTPMGSYRGAGRPEATYLIERSMNIMASKLKLDPVRVRQINYVEKERFPFKTPGGFTYDSGDYEMNLSKALKVADYQGLRQEQREARASGRLVGIGLVTWTEICGFSPGMGQTAAVEVTTEGRVVITIGGHPHGQGHATPMAQIVADELGLPLESMSVRHGDTNMLAWSSVTAGSRSAPLTGAAVLLSAKKIKAKMARVAAHKLGVAPEGMVFEDGKIFPSGERGKALDFQAVAGAAYDGEKIPQGMEPTLFEYSAFAPPNYTFPFGTHIAMVEVDRETGFVKLLKYFAVDDCGRILNPMVVEGQEDGGIVQGIGQAMLEEVVYDENGQLLTSTLADYVIPSAESIPEIVYDKTETPTYANPLGAKGIGEGSAIASTPAVMNAIEDALSQYGVVVDRMPARPDYIRELISKASR